jgi:hypothetical protein
MHHTQRFSSRVADGGNLERSRAVFGAGMDDCGIHEWSFFVTRDGFLDFIPDLNMRGEGWRARIT